MEFFFIDTTPFVNDYWSSEQARDFDWRGLVPRQEHLDTQLEVCLSLFFSDVFGSCALCEIRFLHAKLLARIGSFRR